MSKQQVLHGFEPIHYDRKLITEAVAVKGPIVLKTILQRADAENQNGRRYPKSILEREAELYQTFVKDKRALGELDHPSDRAVVNLANVCLNVTEMHWKGDELWGSVEILTTPSGNILRELLNCGIRLGISSRGMGSVQENADGTVQVDDDFSLICFDAVSNPSTHGAFLHEGVGAKPGPFSRVDELVHDFLTEAGERGERKAVR
jgi:hypothetical protein